MGHRLGSPKGQPRRKFYVDFRFTKSGEDDGGRTGPVVAESDLVPDSED